LVMVASPPLGFVFFFLYFSSIDAFWPCLEPSP
jgi:hypothetical protein